MSSKIRKYFQILRYLPQTIYFNMKYLPFGQAVRLPILLYKPHLLKCKGSIKIEAPLRFGMWRMGFPMCSVYANNGVTWENHGGSVILRGKGHIGNDTYISLGEKTKVDFGEDFFNAAGLKIVSYRGITFGRSTSIGWGVLIMDTNFHPLYDMEKKIYKKASGPIKIGDYNWFGTNCKIMHSVETPERCIFGMDTIVTRGCPKESYCVMGGNPVKILTRNVMRDLNHDREEY